MEPLAAGFEYQPKPGDGTHKWLQTAMPVASIAIMLGSLDAAAWWGDRHGLPRHSALNGLILLVVCEWIAAFFHELGHATAGWMVDMKLAAFAAGPVMAQKKRGKWKLGFTLVSLLGVGGSVVTTPLHTRNLRRRMAMEIAAGPAASLLTAVVAMLVLSAMPGSSWAAWWKIPAVVAAMSAGAAVLNLIPFGFAAGHSDGALLVQLLIGGPFADLREALKIVGATTCSPMRPRDVDPVALSRGLGVAAGRPESGVLQMIEVICAIDRRDLASARVHLESALELIPSAEKAQSPATAAELAFYLAYLDGHAGRAGQWLRDAENAAARKKCVLSGEFDYWLSAVAVRMAEGRDQEADEAWQRAKKLADNGPDTGLYEYERDMLNRLKERDWLRPPDVSRMAEALSNSACAADLEISVNESTGRVVESDVFTHRG